MTQEQITENNKLIAEFMGFKLVPCNNGIAWDNNKIIKPISLHGSLEGHNNGKFHSSWDWLMPVVQKINKIDNMPFFMNIEFDHNGSCTLRVRREHQSQISNWDILVCEENKGIETVHKTVIKFIKWYNESV